MQQLNDIFNQFLNNKPIFTNRSALTISFTPETIPHRDQQIAELGRILAPALRGAKPSNVFIYGRTGTGKSLVSKYVGQALERSASTNGHKIKTIYTNCKMKHTADTEYRLLSMLIKEFGQEVPFTGLPTDRLYNIFFEALDAQKQMVILIIDEIDALVQKVGDGILYNLTRMNGELKQSKISIIGITNDLSFVENLDPRVKSSLNEEELIFPPYNALQLQDILNNRAQIAFSNGTIDSGVIQKAAALAAQEHGDARRALDLLRVAGEIAERGAELNVKITHVDVAQEKIDIDRVIEIVRSQPKQSQAVLWSIIQLAEKAKEVETGDVIETYQKICAEAGLKPLTQRRVSDLIAELDLFGIINTSVVSKGRYGRTRTIKINIPENVLQNLKKLLIEIFL